MNISVLQLWNKKCDLRMLYKIITAKAESMSVAVHRLPKTFPWALLTALMAPISDRTGASRGITEHSKACCMRACWSHALFLYPRPPKIPEQTLHVFFCPQGIAHCIQIYWLRCGWILVARLQTEFLCPLEPLSCLCASLHYADTNISVVTWEQSQKIDPRSQWQKGSFSRSHL